MTTETWLAFLVHLGVQGALLVRVLMRPHREPASRIAWAAVIGTLPVFGAVAYLLLGEVRVGRRRVRRMRAILERMPKLDDAPAGSGKDAGGDASATLGPYAHLFAAGRSISGFEPVAGNQARLLADSNATIDSLVADIDAATRHVHLLFYIWLPDGNGLRVVEALCRAARRGVVCRALADGLGSRLMIRSEHWRAMREAGVRLAAALPVGNPLLCALFGRIDVRNHRKIAVIDGRVTYCGSQNCADPEFRIKAKFAPWVDVMMRFEGPIVRQNQHLFAGDWMAETDENLDELLQAPADRPGPHGFLAQVVGTGPTARHSAMPELFESLFHAARRELIVTTPYYVPDEALQGALTAAARRGVDVTVVFPARNDSRIVAAASRSYYPDLLAAGVKLFEYQGGLLHAKTLTVDGVVTLIGSANMDRRSFELNYENNILFCDAATTDALRRRQMEYLSRARRVDPAEAAGWPWTRRLWNNCVATLGPVL